jgi:hypothetical protein
MDVVPDMHFFVQYNCDILIHICGVSLYLNHSYMTHDICTTKQHGKKKKGSSGNRESNPGFPTTLADWSAAHCSEIGFGLMSLSRTQMDFTYYAADQENGPQKIDSFTMKK